ncbi:MAG: hypothetical protein WB770_07220 [Acidimicrobiales bacterium]
MIISIPFMVLGFAIAIVPLVTVMRRHHEIEREYFSTRSQLTRQVTPAYAHFTFVDEDLTRADERELVGVS